jgi:predicted LPLAT superfamily acyltransferase
MAAIDGGGIVSIMGDRNYGQNTSEVMLFGERVHLPHSAFTIASAAQCPAVVLLSARVSDRKYMVDVSNIIEPVSGPRSQRQVNIDACVQKFAGVLEEYALRYPLQWFVFSDLWAQNKTV